MSEFNADACLALRPEIVVTTLKGGAVLLDLDTKYFYSLNTSAWAITQQFEMPNRGSEVLAMGANWGAPGEQITAFIGRLLEEGLLTETDEEPCPCAEAFEGPWMEPTVEMHQEPLHKVMVSAFDPSLPLAE